MKKLFALLLAVVMVMGLVACAPADDNTTTPPATTTKPAGGDKTTTTTEAAPAVKFPLEEEVTLVLTGSTRGTVINMNKNLADNKLWNDLYKRTNVKIEIKDRGCGIEDLTAALTPLYTTDRENERSGMGFTVMESFTDKMRVTSKPSRGTKVTLIKKLSPLSST